MVLGDEMPFFAIENYREHKALMVRTQSLTAGRIIEFGLRRVAADGHGYEPADTHGLVTLVPMAEAATIRFPQKAYANLQYLGS